MGSSSRSSRSSCRGSPWCGAMESWCSSRSWGAQGRRVGGKGVREGAGLRSKAPRERCKCGKSLGNPLLCAKLGSSREDKQQGIQKIWISCLKRSPGGAVLVLAYRGTGQNRTEKAQRAEDSRNGTTRPAQWGGIQPHGWQQRGHESLLGITKLHRWDLGHRSPDLAVGDNRETAEITREPGACLGTAPRGSPEAILHQTNSLAGGLRPSPCACR